MHTDNDRVGVYLCDLIVVRYLIERHYQLANTVWQIARFS